MFWLCCCLFVCLVFATNFRVKAAMKNSVLLSWEVRDKNPAPPFTVSQDVRKELTFFIIGLF